MCVLTKPYVCVANVYDTIKRQRAENTIEIINEFVMLYNSNEGTYIVLNGNIMFI